MSPPRLPHRPPGPPHPPHPHQWFFNDERECSPQDFGDRLQKIAAALLDRGSVKFGDHEVAPANPSWCTMRYEMMPHGELSLKLELSWETSEGAGGRAEPPESLDIS